MENVEFACMIYVFHYLAHIWRAETTSMRRGLEVVEGQNPEPPFFINEARVRVDLGKTLPYAQMVQDCLDEEEIGITHNSQITPEHREKLPKRDKKKTS